MNSDPRAATDTVVPECTVRLACALPQGLEVERLRLLVVAAALKLDHAVERVHIEVVDDETMSTLHLKHSGIAGTTDVLTFLESERNAPIAVEIVVSADEASRRGAELGHDAEREILLYVVHGLLHCAGFDDHDPHAFERMHAEEDRILIALGVGATFRANGMIDFGGDS